MSYHDYLSPMLSLKSMGYTKRNKRCILKEGMPYALKACQKKKKKKGEEEEENIAHTKKKKTGEKEIMQRSSSTIHQKYPHTCPS